MPKPERHVKTDVNEGPKLEENIEAQKGNNSIDVDQGQRSGVLIPLQPE